MGVLLPSPSGRSLSTDLDPEHIMAEFAAAGVGNGDSNSSEVDSNGLPTRYLPENDKPPCYADVLVLRKSMEAETMLRQLQIQLLQSVEQQRKLAEQHEQGEFTVLHV